MHAFRRVIAAIVGMYPAIPRQIRSDRIGLGSPAGIDMHRRHVHDVSVDKRVHEIWTGDDATRVYAGYHSPWKRLVVWPLRDLLTARTGGGLAAHGD